VDSVTITYIVGVVLYLTLGHPPRNATAPVAVILGAPLFIAASLRKRPIFTVPHARGIVIVMVSVVAITATAAAMPLLMQ